MERKINLSIVVPCYNEGGNIPPLLNRFDDAMRERGGITTELIVVDNNSKDDTGKIIAAELATGKYPFAKTVFEPRAGYGAAIKKGLSTARGDVLAWTHADLQTDPRDVFRAYDELLSAKAENCIVKGSRVERPLSQVIFSFGMAVIASAVLQKRFFEINAQPKLFYRSSFDKLVGNTAPDDFSLDLYLLYRAKQQGYVVKSIPVKFAVRTFGESKWAFSFSSKIKTILRTIRYIFKLRETIHG